MPSKFTPYYRAVRYLETLAATPHDQAYMTTHKRQPERFLARTRRLMELLGNPHRGFSFVHVSGTAGKGTTVALLHNMLRGSGCRVGSFTSPYATTSIEKIRVNGQLIAPGEFARLVERLKPVINKMDRTYPHGRPAYFEIFLALALLYFKKMRCQWVILEVGCGGAYDAGNIISKSTSAITMVGLDHTRLLGNTLEKIAKEKAGIIKSRSHFFTTERRERLRNLFKKVCRAQRARAHFIAAARFQEANAALASAIARHIGLPESAIDRAVRDTRLPCRFEIIQKEPLVILDGAHNPDKIANVMHNLKSLTYKKLYIIFASSASKDARAMIKQLARQADEIIFTQIENKGRKFWSAIELAHLAVKLGFQTRSQEPDPWAALAKTLKKMKPGDALLITGSFYLAGELRKRWVSEEEILRKRKINR